jgi:hypothetical protein
MRRTGSRRVWLGRFAALSRTIRVERGKGEIEAPFDTIRMEPALDLGVQR